MGATDSEQVQRAVAAVRGRGGALLQRGLGRIGIGDGGGGSGSSRATVTIGASPQELVALLRKPRTWPRLIALADPPRVTVEDERTVRWTTAPDAPVAHEGTVELRPAPGERGTEATFAAHLPDAAAVDPDQLTPLATHPLELTPRFLAVKAARRLKSLAETGEVPTLEHNSHAPRASRG